MDRHRGLTSCQTIDVFTLPASVQSAVLLSLDEERTNNHFRSSLVISFRVTLSPPVPFTKRKKKKQIQNPAVHSLQSRLCVEDQRTRKKKKHQKIVLFLPYHNHVTIHVVFFYMNKAAFCDVKALNLICSFPIQQCIIISKCVNLRRRRKTTMFKQENVNVDIIFLVIFFFQKKIAKKTKTKIRLGAIHVTWRKHTIARELCTAIYPQNYSTISFFFCNI